MMLGCFARTQLETSAELKMSGFHTAIPASEAAQPKHDTAGTFATSLASELQPCTSHAILWR